MIRKKIKKFIGVVLPALIIGSVFVPITTMAAPDVLPIKGLSNVSMTFRGSSTWTIRRGTFQTSDGRMAFCLQESNTNAPGVGRFVNYEKGGPISTYTTSLIGSGAAPSADFVRSLFYYADLYCGATSTSDIVHMGVQLALHKYPVSTYAVGTRRVPFNKDAFNPIAEINANGAGYDASSIAISYAEALSHKATVAPVSNTQASISLNRTGGGYINGNTYCVAEFEATGNFDSVTFSATQGRIAVNGNKCAVYYYLNEVPDNIDFTVSATGTKSGYEAYWYQSGRLQYMGIGESFTTQNTKYYPVADEIRNGRIQITKKDSNTGAVLAGASFKVTNQNSGATSYGMTNSSGVAVIENLPFGYYTIEEIGAPSGYYIGKDENGTLNKWTDVAITGSAPNISVEANNLKQKGTISIHKTDAETGDNPQGEAVLNNGTFGIYKNGELVETLTMNEGNTITSNPLELGDYTVKEITPPTGYTLNATEYPITLSCESQNVSVGVSTVEVKNNVIKGNIKIHKTGDRKNSFEGSELNLKGVVFSLYKSNGDYVESRETDNYGNVSFDNLPYGSYIIKETTVPEGYVKCEDIECNVSEERDYSYNITDDIYKTNLRIVKKDSSTQRIITDSETTFKITDNEGNPVKLNGTNTFTTVNGILSVPARLTYGTYKITEVTAPSGYLLDSTPVTFVVDENTLDTVEIVKFNNPLLCQLKINKTGKSFSGIEIEESEYGEVNTPVFSERGLSDVVFELYAKEDIKTSDGTVRFTNGQLVNTLTTVNGTVISGRLYPGKYTLKEKDTNKGYKLDETEYEINLESNLTSEITLNSIDLSNLRSSTKLSLKKDIEKWKVITDNERITREIEVVAGKGFVFGLYAAEDIYTYDGGRYISADSLVAYGTTDEDGSLVFDMDLPFGKYYFKELSVPDERYILLDEKFDIDLTATETDGQEIKSELSDPILNTFSRFNVQFMKRDINTELPLQNTLIEIIDSNGQVIYREYTDENGILPNIMLEPGKYKFREAKAPEGYAIDENTYDFEVKENGEIVGETVLRDDISILLIKKVNEDGNAISGVIFGLYDENGNKIAEATTDINGIARFERFGKGKYYIKEEKAAEGYIKNDSTIYEFENDGRFINKTDPVVTVKNTKIATSPKTGYFNINWYLIALMSACSVVIMIARKKIKK